MAAIQCQCGHIYYGGGVHSGMDSDMNFCKYCEPDRYKDYLEKKKTVMLRHGESKSDSGEQAHTIAISFNFILGLIIACLWCLSFVR